MDGKLDTPTPATKRLEKKISVRDLDENNLKAYCEQIFSDKEFVYIKKAWDIAHEAHKNTTRETGGDYVWHPINVAVILIKEVGLTKDWKAVVAALLHDVVEDTEHFHDNQDTDNKKVIDAISKIDQEFKDEDIANYVLALTKLKRRNRNNPATEKEKDLYVQQLIKFPIAVLVKAADRLHNLRTMPDDKEFVKRYIQDTEEYILPCLEYVNKGNGNRIQKLSDKSTSLLEVEIESLKAKYLIQ